MKESQPNEWANGTFDFVLSDTDDESRDLVLTFRNSTDAQWRLAHEKLDSIELNNFNQQRDVLTFVFKSLLVEWRRGDQQPSRDINELLSIITSAGAWMLGVNLYNTAALGELDRRSSRSRLRRARSVPGVAPTNLDNTNADAASFGSNATPVTVQAD